MVSCGHGGGAVSGSNSGGVVNGGGGGGIGIEVEQMKLLFSVVRAILTLLLVRRHGGGTVSGGDGSGFDGGVDGGGVGNGGGGGDGGIGLEVEQTKLLFRVVCAIPTLPLVFAAVVNMAVVDTANVVDAADANVVITADDDGPLWGVAAGGGRGSQGEGVAAIAHA
jgi:hypothetical protein